MMPLSLKEFTTWLQTHAETRKVEGKLDALVNFVTKLAVNQKPATFARVCGIRSSNEHHTNGRRLPTPSSFGARNDAIVIRGVHDVVTDTSTETRKVEGKLDALVNLVTQLAVNQKSASVGRVCGIPAVRQEISDETDRITGKTKAISNVPIQLSIYSPHGQLQFRFVETTQIKGFKVALELELEAIFFIKCLASAAVVTCYRCLPHKPQEVHSLQVATKKDVHLYGVEQIPQTVATEADI
ncbi:hypothetical protein Fmac_024899 [Flemingia macrophylla]|uniref:Uncharacterized protein n=1 Tax=Flemingia macrophylla TaxID=520843 RepID=A0ABD1LQQ5_9FABA